MAGRLSIIVPVLAACAAALPLLLLLWDQSLYAAAASAVFAIVLGLVLAHERRFIARLVSENDRLARSVDLLELAESLAGVGRWRIDVKAQTHHWSPELCTILGINPPCQPDAHMLETILGEGGAALTTTFERHRKDHEPYLIEFEVVRQDGEYRLLRAKARNEFGPDGEVVQVLMAVSDVTDEYERARQLKEQQAQALANVERAEKLANTDPLTGLANRRHAMTVIDKAIMAARKNGGALSLLVFDLDHFKKINDTFGHVAGDAVLTKVARIARLLVPETDLVARFGGEEFVCLLTGADASAARDFSERLRWSIESGSAVDGVPGCTASIGFATYESGDTSLTLFARADAALYEAKEGGRNQIRMAA